MVYIEKFHVFCQCHDYNQENNCEENCVDKELNIDNFTTSCRIINSYQVVNSHQYYTLNKIIDWQIVDPHHHYDTELISFNNFLEHFSKFNYDATKIMNNGDYDIENLLYYCCYIGDIENIKLLFSMINNYNTQFLISLVLANSSEKHFINKLVIVLENLGVNVNINNIYVTWLFLDHESVSKIESTMTKYKIPLSSKHLQFDMRHIYGYKSIKKIDEYRNFFIKIHQQELLDMNNDEILNFFYYDIDIIKYFQKSGYEFNLLKVVDKMSILCTYNNYFLNRYHDYFGNDFDNLFPKKIILYKKLINNEYENFVNFLESCNFEEITKFFDELGNCDDNESIIIFLKYLLDNNYLLNLWQVLKIYERDEYSDCVHNYLSTRIVESIKKIDYIENEDNFTKLLMKLDINILIENINELFEYLVKFVNNQDFLRELMKYLDHDYDMRLPLINTIQYYPVTYNFKFIYENLEHDKKLEYYNNLLCVVNVKDLFFFSMAYYY